MAAGSIPAAERRRLLRDYRLYKDAHLLHDLAFELGWPKPHLDRAARELAISSVGTGGWKHLPEHVAVALLQRFRASRLGLGAWCRKQGYAEASFSAAMRTACGDTEWGRIIAGKTLRSTSYRLGRNLEYRVRDDLQSHGYQVVRSPSSKSPVDLTANRRGEVMLVQCKRGGSCPPAEWNALWEAAAKLGAIAVLATRHPSGRGTTYHRLLGPKNGSARRQPYEPYELGAPVLRTV